MTHRLPIGLIATALIMSIGCADQQFSLEGSEPETGVIKQALIETIFSDGFENGLGQWTIGNVCDTLDYNPYEGTYVVYIEDTSSITTSFSTVGYTNIQVSFAYRQYAGNYDSGEYLYAEWSVDGSTWHQLIEANNESWIFDTFTLPSAADGVSSLSLRFRSNANGWYEVGYIDALSVTGDSSGGGCTPIGTDDNCDGIDDDCDGSVDEDYVSQSTSCGVGACGATGSTSCVAGTVQDSCSPGSPAADDSTCDGIDDDCDGSVDEDGTCGGPVCGDATCDTGEDCSSCSADCGICGGGSATLYSNDFEVDASSWSGGCARSTSQAQSGSYSLRCGGGQAHTLTIDASGHTNIAIDYGRRGSSLESGETFTVEWSTDGASWTVLETASDESWAARSYGLPGGADNSAALRIRFSTSASSSSMDAAYMDDIVVSGDSGGGGSSCGDGTCDAGEDCSSCSADCGSCSSGTDDPSQPGPYGACYYESGVDGPRFSGGRMYYPCAAGGSSSDPIAAGTFGATTLSPGFTNTSDDIFWLGAHAATHGFVVLVMHPDNTWGNNGDWCDAHEDAYYEIKAENELSGSPIEGAVDYSRLQIMGYSKGGGGTLLAAVDLSNAGEPIAAVQSLAPYFDSAYQGTDLSSIAAPTAFHAGSSDSTAPPSSHTDPMFANMNANTTRLRAIYDGMGHLSWVGSDNSYRPKVKQYIIAWMKYHMDGDTAYYSYINGADHHPEYFTTYELIEP